MSEKEVKVVEATAAANENAETAEEVKYIDPRVGYTPKTVHARKVIASRRAKNKARRKAARKNRK